MKFAARIRPRRQLTGPPLPPELPLVADAVAAGCGRGGPPAAITQAMDKLPSCVSAHDRVEVERSLVREAAKNDAEFVRPLGTPYRRDVQPRRRFRRGRPRPPARLGVGPAGPGRDVAAVRAGSTPKPAAMSKPSPPRCARVAICPTAPSTETPDDRSSVAALPRRHQTRAESRYRLGTDGRSSRASGDGDRAHHAGRTESGRPRRDRSRRVRCRRRRAPAGTPRCRCAT